MKRIGVLLIGAGQVAQDFHLPLLRDSPQVKLLAVCDADANRCQEAASAYDIPGYTDYRCMLDAVPSDAVFLALPPDRVRDIAAACLSQGLDVFLEKPPGTSLEQTQELAELARIHKRITLVGFNRRYTPVLREAKRAVAAHGPLSFFVGEFHKCHSGDRPYHGTVSWLLSDIIHHIDTLRWLGGEVAAIEAHTRKIASPFANLFTLFFEFNNGSTAVQVSHYASGARVERFEIHGEQAAAYVVPPDRAEIFVQNRSYSQPEPQQIIAASDLLGTASRGVRYGYRQEIDAFLQAVRTREQAETSLDDAVETMRLVEQIHQTMAL